MIHPLDGFERSTVKKDEKMRCTFHIKAVATIFDSELDTWFQGILENIMETRQLERDEVFQLKVGHETEYDSFERLITFNYEVSPFSVVYTNARENFLQFIISLFAIIGGVFTFARIIDALIHKGSKLVLKARINKQI